MCGGQDATLLEQIEAIVGEPGAQIAVSHSPVIHFLFPSPLPLLQSLTVPLTASALRLEGRHKVDLFVYKRNLLLLSCGHCHGKEVPAQVLNDVMQVRTLNFIFICI